MEGLGACMASWIGSEPLDDLGHMWLERARNGQVENRGRSVSTVLEVMDCSTRHKNERTLVNVSPLAAKQNAHGAEGYEEDVVLWMRMSTWPLGMRLQPPLRD